MTDQDGLPNEEIHLANLSSTCDEIQPVNSNNKNCPLDETLGQSTGEANELSQFGQTRPSIIDGRRRTIVLLGYNFVLDAFPPLPRLTRFLSLYVGLFFSTLDSSIVSTALVDILSDFGNFELSPWIVLAYMLTYMSAFCSLQPETNVT